jgi:hypothetical protein
MDDSTILYSVKNQVSMSISHFLKSCTVLPKRTFFSFVLIAFFGIAAAFSRPVVAQNLNPDGSGSGCLSYQRSNSSGTCGGSAESGCVNSESCGAPVSPLRGTGARCYASRQCASGLCPNGSANNPSTCQAAPTTPPNPGDPKPNISVGARCDDPDGCHCIRTNGDPYDIVFAAICANSTQVTRTCYRVTSGNCVSFTTSVDRDSNGNPKTCSQTNASYFNDVNACTFSLPSKSLGQNCSRDGECGSNYCKLVNGSNICANRSDSGEVCTGTNSGNNDCKHGFSCQPDGSSRKCKEIRENGRSCATNIECASGYCKSVGDGNDVCTQRKSFGELCEDTADCLNGVCLRSSSSEPKKCFQKKAIGQACGADAQCATNYCLFRTGGNLCAERTGGVPVGPQDLLVCHVSGSNCQVESKNLVTESAILGRTLPKGTKCEDINAGWTTDASSCLAILEGQNGDKVNCGALALSICNYNPRCIRVNNVCGTRRVSGGNCSTLLSQSACKEQTYCMWNANSGCLPDPSKGTPAPGDVVLPPAGGGTGGGGNGGGDNEARRCERIRVTKVTAVPTGNAEPKSGDKVFFTCAKVDGATSYQFRQVSFKADYSQQQNSAVVGADSNDVFEIKRIKPTTERSNLSEHYKLPNPEKAKAFKFQCRPCFEDGKCARYDELKGSDFRIAEGGVGQGLQSEDGVGGGNTDELPVPDATTKPKEDGSGLPPLPTGCVYKEVQCIQAPCDPIVVCTSPVPPSGSPLPSSSPRPSVSPSPRPTPPTTPSPRPSMSPSPSPIPTFIPGFSTQ